MQAQTDRASGKARNAPANFSHPLCGIDARTWQRRRRRVVAMDSESNSSQRPNIFRDLQQRNQRRRELARVLETRRLRQVERVMEISRKVGFRRPRT